MLGRWYYFATEIAQQLMWWSLLLGPLLVALWFRVSGPIVAVFGTVGKRDEDDGGLSGQEQVAATPDSDSTSLAVARPTGKYRQVRFFIQSQREFENLGPVELLVSRVGGAWRAGAANWRLVHGPNVKVTQDHSRAEVYPSAAEKARGRQEDTAAPFVPIGPLGELYLTTSCRLRPLETWEIVCEFDMDVQRVELSLVAGRVPTGWFPGWVLQAVKPGSRHVKGKMEIDVKSGRSGLGEARIAIYGNTGPVRSFVMSLGFGVSAFFVASLLIAYARTPASQRLVQRLNDAVQELADFGIETVLALLGAAAFSEVAFRFWRRPNAPLIQGYRGEANTLTSPSENEATPG